MKIDIGAVLLLQAISAGTPTTAQLHGSSDATIVGVDHRPRSLGSKKSKSKSSKSKGCKDVDASTLPECVLDDLPEPKSSKKSKNLFSKGKWFCIPESILPAQTQICQLQADGTYNLETVFPCEVEVGDETPGEVITPGTYLTNDCTPMPCIFDSTSAENILGFRTDKNTWLGGNVVTNTTVLFCNTAELTIPYTVVGTPAAAGSNPVPDTNFIYNVVYSCVNTAPCELARNNQVLRFIEVDGLTLENIKITGDGTGPSGDTAIDMTNMCGEIVLDSVQIVNQFSDDYGGGFQVGCDNSCAYNTAAVSSVTIRDSLLQNNNADGSSRTTGPLQSTAGGMAVDKCGAVEIQSTQFIDNFSNHDGGGFYVRRANTLTIIDSYFEGNTAAQGPGGSAGDDEELGGLGYARQIGSFDLCGNTASYTNVNSADDDMCGTDTFYVQDSQECLSINNNFDCSSVAVC